MLDANYKLSVITFYGDVSVMYTHQLLISNFHATEKIKILNIENNNESYLIIFHILQLIR